MGSGQVCCVGGRYSVSDGSRLLGRLWACLLVGKGCVVFRLGEWRHNGSRSCCLYEEVHGRAVSRVQRVVSC